MTSVVKRGGIAPPSPKVEHDVESGQNHLVASSVVDHSARNAWIIGGVLS